MVGGGHFQPPFSEFGSKVLNTNVLHIVNSQWNILRMIFFTAEWRNDIGGLGAIYLCLQRFNSNFQAPVSKEQLSY